MKRFGKATLSNELGKISKIFAVATGFIASLRDKGEKALCYEDITEGEFFRSHLLDERAYSD